MLRIWRSESLHSFTHFSECLHQLTAGGCAGEHPVVILQHWSEIRDMKIRYKLKCASCTLMYRAYDIIGIPLY